MHAALEMTREAQSRDPGIRWGIVGILSAILCATAAVVLSRHGLTEHGMHALLRSTAYSSFALFLVVLVASPLAATWPSPGTRWLLDRRRQLGVSFAVSHTIHFAAILGLTVLGTEPMSRVTLLLGGIGYVFIVAMAATSFDRSAAWLGPTRWRRLHTTGLHYLWFVFTATFLGHVRQSRAAAACAALLIAALGWRLAMLRRVAPP